MCQGGRMTLLSCWL